jgi:2-octaprenyl-6-methoxyphenol hydroxylase
MSADLDILIVGGGLVGASLAAALRTQPLRVGLLDQQPKVLQANPNQGARALVLTAGSVDYLKQLMIWPLIAQDATPIAGVEVSKQGVMAKGYFSAEDEGLDYLAQVIAADRLMAALNNSLQNNSNLEFFYEKTILDLKRIESGWQLQLNDGQSLRARLLIGADGTESTIRTMQGIAVERLDDQQCALMFNLGLQQSHQNIAYERFLKTGSIAMIPFGIDQVKCIWITTVEEARVLSALSEAALLQALQQNFGYGLGLFDDLLTAVQMIPLRSVTATTIYDQGLVLIGNAAHTLHPIAAQGFNLGLRDAMILANTLGAAHKESSAIESIAVLQDYARLRAADQHRTRAWTEALANASILHDMGLWAVVLLPPLKRWMSRQGLGVL